MNPFTLLFRLPLMALRRVVQLSSPATGVNPALARRPPRRPG